MLFSRSDLPIPGVLAGVYMNFMKLQYLIVSVMKHSKAVLKWMVATKVD